MAVQTRTTALQNEIVRLYCRFERNGAMANPPNQPVVTILDTDGVTVLQSSTAQLQTTGLWYVDFSVPATLPLGNYYDQWAFQWSANESVQEKTLVWTVFGLDSYINFVSPDIAQHVSDRVIQLMIDLTNEFIYEAQHIPVYWEQGMRVQQEDQAKRTKNYYYFSLPNSSYDIYREDVYENNGQQFTVFQDILTDNSSSSESSESYGSSESEQSEVPESLDYPLVLTVVGTGDPEDVGVLTKVSGDGPSTITYGSVTKKVSHFSSIYDFAYKNWNCDPRPILRFNNRIVDDGWYSDFDGRIYIDGLTMPEDSVNVQYNFRYFSDEEILGFLRFGLKMMNTAPPASVHYRNLATMPAEWDAPVLLYAAVLALKRLVFGLNFQEKFVIFTRPDDPNSAASAIANFKDLYQEYKSTWDEVKKDVKTRKLPDPGIMIYVTPEYTLPGGRSRFFRYLYKS
jgi:hypothetical protein